MTEPLAGDVGHGRVGASSKCRCQGWLRLGRWDGVPEEALAPSQIVVRLVLLPEFVGHAAPEQSLFLSLLTRAVGAHLALEVGTFTGLSALSIAAALDDGGRIICCDVSEEWTAVARRYWAEAGVEDRIDLRIAPASDTLRSLPDQPFLDLAFIDADKPGYVTYWDEIVPRMRPGGVLLVDNVLWRGTVVDDGVSDENTEAIRQFNDHAAADARVDLVMLPISDGLTMAVKRR